MSPYYDRAGSRWNGEDGEVAIRGGDGAESRSVDDDRASGKPRPLAASVTRPRTVPVVACERRREGTAAKASASDSDAASNEGEGHPRYLRKSGASPRPRLKPCVG